MPTQQLQSAIADNSQLVDNSPAAAPVTQQTAPPVDAVTQARQQEEASYGLTSKDYLGAMWRQDSWIPGLIDHYAGAQLAPDPTYNPYDESVTKDLNEGVWPEFQGAFSQATSAGQAAWIKQNILQKQKDLQDLSTLGTKGNVGRFAAGMAFGIVDPINLVAMAASGGTSLLARGAEVAATVSRARSIATGLGTAGILGAGTEKLRQSYNFEDDKMGVLTAGLTSMAFAAPFVGLHAHEQAKVSQAAMQEANAIEALRKQQAGEPLEPHEEANLHAYTENLKKAMDVEAGRAEQAHEVAPVREEPLQTAEGEAPVAAPQADVPPHMQDP
jgi:hypothetical protein